MKILFVMHYPGYLRYFDSTVRLLAARGHTVYLAFNSVRKQAEGAEAVAGVDERIVMLGAVPRRGDRWVRVARGLRRTIDYARYLHPAYVGAPYLRDRMALRLPAFAEPLTRLRCLPPRSLRLLLRLLTGLEQAIPSSAAIEAFITSVGPDLVLVSPLVGEAVQTDLVKSGQALGLPVGLCVASWDHLTTKGLMRVEPDLVVVWNEIQRQEAVRFHDFPAGRVVVTGAQPFDRWFERQPSGRRAAFCDRVGLPDARPYVLFVGSTASISAPDAEKVFVKTWIRALRASPVAAARDLAVLVRPHPYNSGHWRAADLAEFDHVAIWPRAGANPVNEQDRADYFDSLYHSAAVVGINTSAMIEAAIVGRPVLTILQPEFSDTQAGTIHFRYLLAEHGGFLRVAPDLETHARQLGEVVARPEEVQAQLQRFVRAFVRPAGLDRPCTPAVVAAIESLGRLGRRPKRRVPPGLLPVQLLLWGIALRPAGEARLRRALATVRGGLARIASRKVGRRLVGGPVRLEPLTDRALAADGEREAFRGAQRNDGQSWPASGARQGRESDPADGAG